MIVEAGITDTKGRAHRYHHDRLPEHWVCGVSLSGSAWKRSGGTEAVSHAPTISYSLPGVTFDLATLAPHDWYSINAIFTPRPEWEQHLRFPEFLPGHGRILLGKHPYRAEIVAAFRDVYRWTRMHAPCSAELAMNALERAFLLAVNGQGASSAPMDERLATVSAYVLTHMDQAITIATLADVAKLSPSRFAHLFKQVFKMPPMRYVERIKMEEAQSLLVNSSLPVRAIARQVGYDNPFHFSLRFSRFVGVSPSAFRNDPSVLGD